MNLSKSYEFFKPETLKGPCHIIGCGSVGSTVAELLARFGITDFVLYDFDFVEAHNIVNQMFTTKHLGRQKIECVKEMLEEINPDVKVRLEPSGWEGQPLNGYVFLAVDNIDLRREIANSNKFNAYIWAMFDFRTGLTDAQHFAADWTDMKAKKAFIDSMNFNHEEVKDVLSACHVSMCVAPTVRLISNVGVANFINFAKGEHLYKQIIVDAFSFMTEAIG